MGYLFILYDRLVEWIINLDVFQRFFLFLYYGCPSSNRTKKLQIRKRLINR